MELVRQDRIGCFTQQVARERARQGLEMPWAGGEDSRWVLVGGWRGHRSGRPGWGWDKNGRSGGGEGCGREMEGEGPERAPSPDPRWGSRRTR